jgi:quinol-cytochrome oxidoreductase complex cytochrome b subunit
MKLIARIVLGILAAAGTGAVTILCFFALLSGGIWPSLRFHDIVSSIAMFSLFSVVAVVPGIFIVLFLDQSFARFRQSRSRKIYCGFIGILVMGLWCLLLGGFKPIPVINPAALVFAIASFLSAFVFSSLVTFPSPGSTEQGAAANP